jgi:hypothetical protein
MRTKTFNLIPPTKWSRPSALAGPLRGLPDRAEVWDEILTSPITMPTLHFVMYGRLFESHPRTLMGVCYT